VPDFVQILNFEKAASILGATPADVRVLVVEERTLPALYVTQVGYKEPFQYQLLRVDEIGRAFDMAAGGLESTICTGFLRIERAELNRYIEKLAPPTAPAQPAPSGDGEGDTFEPLLKLIEPYINEPFANLPDSLRVRVAEAFFPMPQWDDLAPDQRRSLAEQDDNQTDPAKGPEREYWWALACQVSETEESIAKWQLMNDRALPSEAALKETQLVLLKRRLDNLQKLLKLPPFTVTSWEGLTDEVLAAAVAPATPPTPAASTANSEAKDWAMRAAREAMNPVEKLKSQLMVSSIAEVQHQLELTKLQAALGSAGLTPGILKMAEEQRHVKNLTGSISIADAVRQIGESQLTIAAGSSAASSAADAYKQLGLSDSLSTVAKQFLEAESAKEQAQRAAGYAAPREIEVPLMPLYDPMKADRRYRARKREEDIETARLSEIARLQARDEYEAKKQAQSPPPTPASTAPPIAFDGSTLGADIECVVPCWTLTMPKRFPGYSKPLYDYLKAAHAAGKHCPSARNVLDDWKRNKPVNVAEVSDDGLKYYDANGNTKPADLAAIRKAIERMTT
jgi:hypothetical protein